MASQASLEPALISLDWGTSNCRGWLLTAQGNVIDTISNDRGIGRIDGDVAAEFEAMCADWPACPAILAGMVGSRQGWREANYVACPTSIDALGGALLRFRTDAGREVAIIPGLSLQDGSHYDVIRGEETQIAGFTRMNPEFAGVCIMPGTHSKWVDLDHGEVRAFQTFMTGELFELTSKTSFLRHSVEKPTAPTHESPAFGDAVSEVLKGTPFQASLFGVRARQLLTDSGPEENYAHLSGLIIAGEIVAASALGLLTPGRDLAIIGSGGLNDAYASALSSAGYTVQTVGGDEAVLAGLVQLAQLSGLTGETS